MQIITPILVVLGIIISGCSFGEYADEDKKKITNTIQTADGTTYKFTKKSIENKTFFKTFKLDNKWNMSEYDFNATHFKANQIKGGNNQQTGKYSITNDGYLKLIVDPISYVKPIKEDSEKIYLLWTTNAKDLNQTEPTKDTYFFKTKQKAESFMQIDQSPKTNPPKTAKNNTNMSAIYYLLLS